MKPVLVLTTVHAAFDAAALARELVEMRLAACVNILPGFRSIYRWEGKVEEEGEQLLLIKTAEGRVDELRRQLLTRHPYDLPEFLVVNVDQASRAYGAWLVHSSTPQPS
ncbi:MAG: divalent-cation tolerance protein CutA [Thermoanaerobaculia bacterium]